MSIQRTLPATDECAGDISSGVGDGEGAVGRGVAVDGGVGVGEEVTVGIGVSVSVGTAVSRGVLVGEGVAVDVGEGMGVPVAVGVGQGVFPKAAIAGGGWGEYHRSTKSTPAMKAPTEPKAATGAKRRHPLLF